MATITGFKSRKLASSAVGTPGVDIGTAVGFQNLANNTAQIAIQMKQNQIITDKVDALKTAQDITQQAGTKITAQQGIANANPKIDTNESINIQQQFFDKETEIGLAGIKNKRVKNLTKLQLAQNRASVFNNITKWGMKRQAIKSFIAGTNAINTITQQAESIPTWNELKKTGGLLEQSRKWGEAVAPMLSDKDRSKVIKASLNSPVRGYINGRIKDNPIIAEIEFNSNKEIHQRFDIEEQAEIRADIDRAKKGLDPTVNTAAAFMRTANADKFKDLMIADDPRLYKEALDVGKANNSLSDADKRLLNDGIKRSRTQAWLNKKENLQISAKIQNNMKEVQEALDKGLTVSLETLEKVKHQIIREEGLTLSKEKAINFLKVLETPTEEALKAFLEQEETSSFYKTLLRGYTNFEKNSEVSDAFTRTKNYWDVYLPGIDFKTGKFNINKVNIKVPESFLPATQLANAAFVAFSSLMRTRVNAAVKGMDLVKRHVEVLNVPKDVKEKIKTEMVDIYYGEVAKFLDKPENITKDIKMTDVMKILENFIPQTAFLKDFGGIPPDGLDIILNGEKLTAFPDGTFMRR